MATTVVGLFDDRDEAQAAVHKLVELGIPHRDVSVVASSAHGRVEQTGVDEGGNMAAEGATTGAASGLVVGGIIGALAGIGLGFVPFLGFLVAGPLAGALTGAAAGLVTGGLLGGLIGLGIPEEHAHAYAEGVRRGGVLVAARCDSEMVDRARAVMDEAGAVNIEERLDTYRQEGFDRFDERAPVFSEEQARRERERLAREGSQVGTPGVTGLRGRSYAYADNPEASGGATGGTGTPGSGLAEGPPYATGGLDTTQIGRDLGDETDKKQP